MKKALIGLLVPALLSCSKPQRATVTFPNFTEIEDELVTYEGVLPGKEGMAVHVELSLKPAAPGLDSYYFLKEDLEKREDREKFVMNSWSRGRYAVLAAGDGSHVIQILDKHTMKAITRGSEFRKPDYVTENMYLKSRGANELVLTDENFQESVPPGILIRRSTLFTAEGYFTVYADSTSDFYERNTGKEWPVAHLGQYWEAVSNYHWLAKEKFEGVYLKALAYTVLQSDSTGQDFKAIVIKRIITIDSTKAIL